MQFGAGDYNRKISHEPTSGNCCTFPNRIRPSNTHPLKAGSLIRIDSQRCRYYRLYCSQSCTTLCRYITPLAMNSGKSPHCTLTMPQFYLLSRPNASQETVPHPPDIKRPNATVHRERNDLLCKAVRLCADNIVEVPLKPLNLR